jgi:plastocyanin
MRALLALCGWLLGAGFASAADLNIALKDASGLPVKDAVVTFAPARDTARGPVKFDWPMRMSQQDKQFDPFVLIVPVGADVSFPNKDPFRHHVYSFSPAKRFELKLYGKDETRSVKFDKVGVVALGCNIHDTMVSFIKVVDTPYAAKSDSGGRAIVHGAPAGPGVLSVWHPYMRAPGGEISRPFIASEQGSGVETVTIDVRPPPPMTMR